MADTSYVIDLLPSTGVTGYGPAVELPGPKKDLGLFFLGASGPFTVDIEYSPDGVNWVVLTGQGGSSPYYLELPGRPTAWVRANLTSVTSGTVAVKMVVA